MKFFVIPGRYAVARLDAAAEVPPWCAGGAFTSVTRTPDELSIVCDESAMPDDVRAERGFACIGVEGPIPFDTTGVAAAFTRVLAQKGLSVFMVSTFDTDYLLVRELERALEALETLGAPLTGSQ